jgi:molecular chaperone DnaK (HSP70)
VAADKKRDIFVSAIEMVDFGGYTCIPTAVAYSKEDCAIGFDAYATADEPSRVCSNFKIQLGEQEPGLNNPKSIFFENGLSRSIHAISSDYLKSVVRDTERWIGSSGLTKASRVLVAEPLAIHEKGDWLANYRNHIRRILASSFSDIDFLPEPFAVFQYYRYGSKHPLIAQKKKHVALILDFGGGTFDVSVIETTAQGDISASGRNSRPLAASSIAVGGFYFNRLVAQHLLFKPFKMQAKKPSAEIQEALRKYDELRRDPRANARDYRQDYQNFFRHFENLLFEVEKAKITICSNISDWTVDGQPTRSVGYQIKVPSSPLSEKTEFLPIRLDALELRQVFVEKLWKSELYPAITNALLRAKGELEAQPISVILLSGGSSNIRWLHRLLMEANHRDLAGAELLELQENFQEIVAKGLAIECARKAFSKGDGDFRAVTYNRLCLGLNPDARGIEVPRFRPVTNGLPEGKSDGVLLPSASLLEKFIGEPIAWKAKLSHPPKQQLDYYFMASSFDPDDIQNVHNAVDHTVRRPSSTSFDKSLTIELRVTKDGTTYPRFIYRTKGPDIPEISVDGRPFYMDMTFGGTEGTSEAYVGIDFGTSNSSVSYVNRTSITVYTERSHSLSWQNISDLASSMPYPIAAPLIQYLSAATNSSLDLKAIEVIEGFLEFAAYVAYAEHCINKGRRDTKLFKEFSKRSAGPLWALLRKCVEQLDGRGEFSAPLQKLFEEPLYSEIDQLVTSIGPVKHGTSSQSPDYNRFIRLLGNVFSDYCSKFLFGYFQDVQKKPFRSEYKGVFRHALGGHNPFVVLYEYEGTAPFSDDLAVLVSSETGRVLSLSPLMFWFRPMNGGNCSDTELYSYDQIGKEGFSYKPSGTNDSVVLDEENFGPLVANLNSMKQSDHGLEYIEGVSLTSTIN